MSRVNIERMIPLMQEYHFVAIETMLLAEREDTVTKNFKHLPQEWESLLSMLFNVNSEAQLSRYHTNMT